MMTPVPDGDDLTPWRDNDNRREHNGPKDLTVIAAVILICLFVLLFIAYLWLSQPDIELRSLAPSGRLVSDVAAFQA